MNNDELKDYIRSLELFADQNVVVLETFLNREWSKTNPPPIKPNITFPIQLIAGILLGISAGAASGLRVFDRFYSVAFKSSQNNTLAGLESVFAVVAINGAIMLLPFVLRRNVSKVVDGEKSANQWIFVVSLIVALFISFIAGFGQSLVGVDAAGSFVSGFDWVLAFSLSLITALEYLFGDVIARNLDSYLEEKEKSRVKHDEDMKSWRASGKGKLAAWLKKFESGNLNVDDEYNNKPEKQSYQKSRSRNQKDQIKIFLNGLYKKTSVVPTFSEAMDAFVEALVLSGHVKDTSQARESFKTSMKGQMSNARNEWLYENNLN